MFLLILLKEDMPNDHEDGGLRTHVVEDKLKTVPGSVGSPGSEFPVFKLMLLDFLFGQVLIGPLITTCWRGAWISFNVFLDDYLFKVCTYALVRLFNDI